MDLFGQMLLIFGALMVACHGRPDGLNTLPDGSVFEMTPPKEFMELFKPDDNKQLNNPMKSPVITALRSQNLEEIAKYLPDPSVFEMTPPKEFLDLFRLKEKENDTVTQNDVSVSPKKEPTVPLLDKEHTKSTLDEKLPEDATNSFELKENEEPRTITKWPSWPFEMNDLGRKMKFPDWFYLPSADRDENINIDKQADTVQIQKPDEEWNQQTFESHSFYYPSFLGGMKLEPFNMFASNIDHAGIPSIPIKKEEDNDTQARKKVDPIITHNTETVVLDNDKKDRLSDDKPTPIENITHDERDVKTNKNADADISVKEEILSKKDIERVSPTKVIQIPEIKPLTSKGSNPGIHVLVPVKLVPTPPNQHYDNGNMVYMSTRYPQNYGSPMLSMQMPNQAYSFAYTNQPNQYIALNPQSLEDKPKGLASTNSENELVQKPKIVSQGIPTSPPNSDSPAYVPINFVSQNHAQNRPPVFMNLSSTSSNRVPLNYVWVNGLQTNGQLSFPSYQHQINTNFHAQGGTVPSSVGGYNQNNLYTLVPIPNDYRPNSY